ncbi:MAG: hypothetical protein GEV28_33130 [Actinophytocola sp.]|uniref:hypothetical protein n=1 Tax=Actinophytocola sp. TaxID=1872138 RepID=UPI001324067F|nr:hypothetical protein [Actinophytocola sp.]MPZ84971.1 hypothetical protein [Actinophytocola sp.]
MSEKQEIDSIRISQVLAAALAAVTAALLGSTVGVAGTVVGAGLASIVSTVGGALYLRSIQRTRRSVQSVRNKVVTRAGATTVTLTDEEPEPEPEEERPPSSRRIGWPAMIVGSVLAFVLGMTVITGIEWIRGEPLSGGEGTTVGDIVRTHPGGGGDRDDSPAPPTRETTIPGTGGQTVTVTPTPTPTSADEEPSDPPSDSSAPDTSVESTTTGGTPSGSGSAPPSDNAG